MLLFISYNCFCFFINVFESNILFLLLLLQLLFYFLVLWSNLSTDLTSANSQRLRTFPTTRMQIQHSIYPPPRLELLFDEERNDGDISANDGDEPPPIVDVNEGKPRPIDDPRLWWEVQDNEDVDVHGPQALKRKMPMPSDALWTSHSSGHLPEWPENGKPSRCRLPGCDSPKCRIRCSTVRSFCA